jgi:hypothetical protein
MKKTTQNSNAISQKQTDLRNKLWPGISDSDLWQASTRKSGYTTIPRALPYILQLMNDLAPNNRVSETYLAIWCRAYKEFFITITNQYEMAYEAGFSGQRAHITWQKRMEKLNELKFIQTKKGPSGKFNYVLILNPYHVIKLHIQNKAFPNDSEKTLNGLIDRISQIRAKDMDDSIDYLQGVGK